MACKIFGKFPEQLCIDKAAGDLDLYIYPVYSLFRLVARKRLDKQRKFNGLRKLYLPAVGLKCMGTILPPFMF